MSQSEIEEILDLIIALEILLPSLTGAEESEVSDLIQALQILIQ